MRHFLGTFALLTAALPSQDLVHKAPPQQRGIVIEAATIHPVSGPVIERGWIYFDEGVIRLLGEGETPDLPGDPMRIDGAGQHVYPGLVAAVTTIGLVEIGQVPATRDESETGDITPEVRAAVAVNPDSTVIPVTRSNGVLAAGVFPTGGLIPGRASVMAFEGWTWEEMAVLPDAGLVVSWPSSRRSRWSRSSEDTSGERRAQIRRAFGDARAYVRAKSEDPSIPVDLRWEGMRAVLAGDAPVFVRANDVEQIESAVSWARSEGLRLVVVGGTEAHLCADLLVRADVPVIVSGTHRLPRRRDVPFDEPFALPVLLEEAGVRWCLATGGSFYNERNLPYHAATAVAFGLSREAALRAITLSPAEILGVGDRLGSLDVGKSATLIVTNGDPLEIPTGVQRAYIDGRALDLRNKQTDLAEKYREKYRQLGLWPEDGGEHNHEHR